MPTIDPEKLLELFKSRCTNGEVRIGYPTTLHIVEEIRRLRAENKALMARVQGDEGAIHTCMGVGASSTACDDQLREEVSHGSA